MTVLEHKIRSFTDQFREKIKQVRSFFHSEVFAAFVAKMMSECVNVSLKLQLSHVVVFYDMNFQIKRVCTM